MQRLLLPALGLGLLLGMTQRCAAQDDPKEIVRKAIAAHGGADKLNKFKASRVSSKGTISIGGMTLDFTSNSVAEFPDKQKTTIKMSISRMEITVVQTVNGAKMKQSVNGM